jgi:hypothetical protein
VTSSPPSGRTAGSTPPGTNVDAKSRRKGGWRGWDAGVRATIIGTVAGVLSLAIAFAAWQWPRSPDSQPKDGPTTVSGANPPIGSAAAAPGGSAAVEYLDGGAFPAESGGANLVSLPRAIRDDGTYKPHAVAITCPSNETGDQVHDVTYPVQGRYVQFDADVHPYYPPGADARSATYVSVLKGVRQRDGDLRITEVGAQKQATAAQPAPLTAAVDDAEKITLRVQCADPNGTVVLTNARLTGT